MSQDDMLGRDPLETERDSIWMAPKSPETAKPYSEKDYSKVVVAEEAPRERAAPAPAKTPVKEGTPLISSAAAPKAAAPASPAPQEAHPGGSWQEPAAKKEEEGGLQETEQLVGFKLSREFFGINIINVQEIIRFQEITIVPRTPEFVEGVISLRGRVIPVINLRKRFRLEAAQKTKETRIIIIELDCGTVGFIVDAVTEVTSIPKSSIDPAPPTATGINKEYIKGVGKLEDKLMIILDLNMVLSREAKEKIKHMNV